MTDMAVYASLGRAIATRRNRLRKTQQEIALQIGVSRASIANIECGRQKVLLHQVYQLVKALELKSITELVPTTLNRAESDLDLPISRSDLSEAQREGLDDMVFAALRVRNATSKAQ
jgi:transcriptional regulator with XRE-family HTH domain